MRAWPGGLFTAALAEIMRGKARRSGSPWRRASMVQATVHLSCGVDEAANRCRDLMLNLGEERPTMQVEGSAMEIVTPPTRRSFGTVIRAELTDRLSGTDVTVSAWPG